MSGNRGLDTPPWILTCCKPYEFMRKLSPERIEGWSAQVDEDHRVWIQTRVSEARHFQDFHLIVAVAIAIGPAKPLAIHRQHW